MRTPLTILTVAFGIGFLDGALEIGFSDTFYIVLGLIMIQTLGYMWYLQIKQDNSQ